MSLTVRQSTWHCVTWLVFIAYEVSFVLILNPSKTPWWQYTGNYALNIFLFYFNAHIVFYYAYRSNKTIVLLLFLLPFELVLHIIVKYWLELLYNYIQNDTSSVEFNKIFILSCIWRSIYFIGISTGYWFATMSINNIKKINQLNVEKLQAESKQILLERNLVQVRNAFLQSQINPHLLFNTLNYLYNDIYKLSPKTSESVMLLSDIMRYALQDAPNDGMVNLDAEVSYINKYILLNQLRFRNPLHLTVNFTGAFASYRIPPLILLTIVENIYKHGDLTDSSCPALFSLAVDSGKLILHSKNKQKKYNADSSHGIGLQNMKNRLESLYPSKKPILHITQNGLLFELHLQIDLLA